MEGDTAGREEIFSNAVEMIMEKPLLGWGPVKPFSELGSRLGGWVRDPHNLYFWLLLEVGLLGALPFLGGLYLCWRRALNGRAGIHGRLPMALMLFVLIINLKGSYHTGKLFWIILAYAAASGSMVRPPKLVERISKSHHDFTSI